MNDLMLFAVSATFGTILIIVSLVILGRYIKFKSKAVKVKAHLVEFHCDPSPTGRKFFPVYDLEINGETERVTSEIGANPPVGKPGDVLMVLCNPDRHTQCLVPGVNQVWGIGLFIGFCGVALILAGALF